MDRSYSDDKEFGAFGDVDGVSGDIFDQVELTEPLPGHRPRNDGRVRSCLRKVEPQAPTRLGKNIEAARVARETASETPSLTSEAPVASAAEEISNDIGPVAAQRLSQLPEGIGILKGKSSTASEEDTLGAIRNVLTEEKREKSRALMAALPLPEQDGEGATSAPDTATSLNRAPLRKRAGVWIRDHVMLIANASLWTVLTTLLISGPVLLSASVLLDGVFYLFCIVCVLKPEILSGLIRDLFRSLRRTTKRS